MRLRIDRIGQWDLTAGLISRLASEFTSAGQTSLQRFGLKMEAIVKKHMADQDLRWIPLQPATISQKVKRGYSTDILIASSTYFQAITSNVTDDTVFVGVPKGTREPNGADTWMIAQVHEFGSQTGGIPARPLWRPSFQEALDWHFKNNRPEQIVMERLKRFTF